MNSGRKMAVDSITTELDEILADINSLREEEETYYDNLSESDKDSENGENSAEVIEWLDKAYSSLFRCITCLEETIR